MLSLCRCWWQFHCWIVHVNNQLYHQNILPNYAKSTTERTTQILTMMFDISCLMLSVLRWSIGFTGSLGLWKPAKKFWSRKWQDNNVNDIFECVEFVDVIECSSTMLRCLLCSKFIKNFGFGMYRSRGTIIATISQHHSKIQVGICSLNKVLCIALGFDKIRVIHR